MRLHRTTNLTPALLSCALLLLTLALVGSGTAGAANTASELRVERKDPLSVVEEGGIRPFAGRDRYETAVLLAERYLFQRGALIADPTVILVSGETLADGLVAAGLAGREQAPILLTPRGALPDVVAEFIDRHNVTTVIAVGGSGSISQSVLAEIAALEVKPNVRRIGGAHRYATAANAAAQLDGLGSWCGTVNPTAVLAHGSEARLAEVAGVSSVAFAQELPILLTRGDELPGATLDYLREHSIERVVILGGKTVVSDDVISPLLDAGIDEITRFASSSAGISESAMAQLLTVTCRHELEPSQNFVALAGRNSAFDAVTAAPLLRTGLDDSGPVPLVLVDDPLPSAARSLLARTPREIDGRKHHVRVVAIGGLGAVDEATMTAAVDAAASARVLTARIGAAAGANTLRITFSESLNVDFPRFSSRIRDLLYINGVPASIAEQELVSSVSSDPCGRFRALNVTLRKDLEAGDVVRLENVDHWRSTNGDRRHIRGTSYTVPEPRPSLGRPSIEVIALPGESKLWMSVAAAEYRDPEAETGGGITLHSSRIRVVAEDGTAVSVGPPQRVRLDRFLGTTLFSFDLEAIGGGSYSLAKDDLIILRSGAAVNANDRRSSGGGTRAVEVGKRLGVTAVRVGPPNPGVDDSVRTIRPEEIANISRRAQASLGDSLFIVGKWSGSAAGATGNAWEVFSSRVDASVVLPDTTDGDDEPPATVVGIDNRRRIISIRHVNAPAGEVREQTYGELAQLLNSNRDFSSHFLAELDDPCEGADEMVDLNDQGLIGTAKFSGGISSISFLVTFSDYVENFLRDNQTVDTGPSALISDILEGLLPDGASPTADQLEVAAPVPGKDVMFRFTTEEPEHTIGQIISTRSKRIDIGESIAASYRPDDDSTADVDESISASRALFATASRDSRLLSDLSKGGNSGG